MAPKTIRLEMSIGASQLVLRGLAKLRTGLEKLKATEEEAGVPSDATRRRIDEIDELARQLGPQKDLFDAMPEAWTTSDDEGKKPKRPKKDQLRLEDDDGDGED